jgi:hypothetical protein
MTPCRARWLRWTNRSAVLLGVLLVGLLVGGTAALAAPPAKPKPKTEAKLSGFAAVLQQTMEGRRFARTSGPDQPAASAMFDQLVAGNFGVPPLSPAKDVAQLDRVITEACPKVQPPSETVKASTPFLLTGKFDAKTAPPGATIAVSAPSFAKLELPMGRFLIYSITLTGAKIAPAPIVETRGISLEDCRASGDSLSLVDGTKTDATITGQGLVVIGGEPVWVVTARIEPQVGVILQPLDRRLKNYQVDDGWKFLSVP